MANKIQLKRGLKSKLPTLSQGEPAFTTDTRELYLGTGSGNVNMSGSQWYTGTGMSGTSTSTTYYYSACPQVKVGDMFLNTTYGYVYQCTTAGSGTTARWTYKGSIRGAKGDKGEAANVGSIMEIIATFFTVPLTLSAATDAIDGILSLGDVSEKDYEGKIFYAEPAYEDYSFIRIGYGNEKGWYLYDSTGNSRAYVYPNEKAFIKFGTLSSGKAYLLQKWT